MIIKPFLLTCVSIYSSYIYNMPWTESFRDNQIHTVEILYVAGRLNAGMIYNQLCMAMCCAVKSNSHAD